MLNNKWLETNTIGRMWCTEIRGKLRITFLLFQNNRNVAIITSTAQDYPKIFTGEVGHVQTNSKNKKAEESDEKSIEILTLALGMENIK